MQKKRGRLFFSLYIVFLVIGLFLNLAYTQKELFFWVNRHNNAFLDEFMKLYTNAGDGLFCIAIALLFILFVKVRDGVSLILTYALSGILVQVLKRYVFTDHQRPWAAFAATGQVHLVPDFIPFTNNSFPSGHEATAFCMATLLVLIITRMRPWAELLLFVLALLVAYSRMYLSQHYFIDVYVGSVVGALSSILVYYYLYQRKRLARQPSGWFDKPVIRVNK